MTPGAAGPRFTGVAVALVTLFAEDGSVAVRETGQHAARLVEAGIEAVLVNGSTGEAAALSDAERMRLVSAVRAACPDVPVLAGASGDWWQPAADRVVAAVSAGADAVLVAPSRFGGPLGDHYRHVRAAAGDVPVLAYHYPPVAGGAVPLDELADLPVAGIKDSSGDPDRLARELDLGLPVYTGSAALLGYAHRLGAAGAIVAAANLVPELCRKAWDGDTAAQRELLRVEHAYGDRFPRGLKAAMADRYGTPAGSRLG